MPDRIAACPRRSSETEVKCTFHTERSLIETSEMSLRPVSWERSTKKSRTILDFSSQFCSLPCFTTAH